MTADSTLQRITFRGEPFLYVGIPGDGAITTDEAFRNFETSFAHLIGDDVFRYGQPIGTIDDIVFLGETELEPEE